MPSWWNWSFPANQCFPGKTMEKYKIVSSSEEFFSKCSSGHLNFGFHTLLENVCQRPEFLHTKSANRVKTIFFEKNFLSQSVFLDRWNAVLTNLLKMFRQENGFSLLIAQRSKRFGFSRKFFFEMFRWTRRMLIWGTWSFLASHNFLGKTMKWYKVVFASRKTFFKVLLLSRRFRSGNPCRKFCQKSRNSSIKISKQSQIDIFFEKTIFCPRVFLWTHRMRIWQHCQNCSSKKPATTCSLPKCHKVLFSSKTFTSKRSTGHVECLPGSSTFSFAVFVDTQITDLNHLVDTFAKSPEFFR